MNKDEEGVKSKSAFLVDVLDVLTGVLVETHVKVVCRFESSQMVCSAAPEAFQDHAQLIN